MPTARALRSVAHFRCLAEGCEDTCCRGLQIPVDAPAYGRLKGLLAKGPDPALAETVELEREPEGARAVARLRMRQDGSCPFFAPDRLCSLHREHGQGALPEVCALFPRVLSRAGGRLEVSGSLACPEVARRGLLEDGGADRVEIDTAELPRAAAPSFDVSPEELAFREAAEAVIRLERYPISSRVLVLAHLAVDADPARWPSFATDELAAPIHRNFQVLAPPTEKAIALLSRILDERRAHAASARFSELLSAIRARLEGKDAPAALALYLEARSRQQRWLGDRLPRWFRNYALHQLARTPLGEAPSRAAYTCRLALRMAMARFALAFHPALQEEAPPAAADAAAAETFQLWAKELEQHPVFRAAVDSAVACPEPDRFLKAVLFAELL